MGGKGIEAEWNADMKDNINWNEVVEKVQSRQSDAIRKYQALKRKLVSVAQARKNMLIYLKNMVQTLFKEGPEIDTKRIKAPRKRTRKEKVETHQTVKKKKGDQKLEEQQEAEELKKNLEIVLDDGDDIFVNVTPLSSKPPTIMDYKIYKEGKKEHIQIIRANGNHQMYLAFSTMLTNFNR
nr:hypothetical protein [Tanacetum cinerariifolium]